MRSILSQLDSDASALLLYAAGELPQVDRHVVEARLATETDFRALADELRAADRIISTGFESLDQNDPLPGSMSLERSIQREIRQWQVNRLARPQTLDRSTWRRRIGYSASAAALLVISYTAWWGFQGDARDLTTGRAGTEIVDATLDPIQDFSALSDDERELDQVMELRTSFQ